MFTHSTHLYYRKSDIAFLTKHGKEGLLSPILEPFLGVKIKKIDAFDTDLLGTFARDVKRLGSQIETARKKALLAIEKSGLKYGLGSEGSLSGDPYYGMAPWDHEVLVFVDSTHNHEIIGVGSRSAKILQKSVDSLEELLTLAKAFSFPDQHIIMRPDKEDDERIFKDIETYDKLARCYHDCIALSVTGKVFVESDLRAYACPSRQEVIKLAGINLLMKMHSLCPECNTPGYWPIASNPGLPCEYCHTPTGMTLSIKHGCHKCGYEKTIARPDSDYADPSYCPQCNP